MDKKTFSLIGAGRMGQNHLQVALNLGMEITSVYDVNKESLTNISKSLSASTVLTSDLSEFISTPSADITTIATTSPSHSELIDSLARAERKTIICEKPLATSIAELTQIKNLVSEFHLKVAVNHQMRFMDQYRLIKGYQSEYQLGKLCTMNVSGANFGLGMNATHYIEAFHWLVGAEITSVSGNVKKQKNANVRGSEFYDYAGYLIAQAGLESLLILDFQESSGHQVLVIYNFEFGKITVNELAGTLTIDSRLVSDLQEPSFRYGMPNFHTEAVISPAELTQSTAELYSQVLVGGDYPSHLDGERSVRVALASILSTDLGGLQVKMDDPALDQIDRLSWP
jgi:predicted dehydrogenase